MSSDSRKQAERLMKQRTKQSDRERNSKEYIFRDRDYVLIQMHTSMYANTAKSNKCCDIHTESLL